MIKNQHIENLFLRLMEGEELSKDELSLLKEWVDENPDDAKEYYAYSLIWNELDTLREVNDEEINEKWSDINNKYIKENNNTFLLLRKTWKYAAIFILGIILTSLVFIFKTDDNVSYQVVEVPFGAKSTIQLTDGTEVILNAGSKIEYDTRFNQIDRKINLIGEAYFKVAKNKNKPFTVITDNMTVKAYGTIFNVKAYPGDKNTETTLIEGSVGIKLKNNNGGSFAKEIFLKPNERIVYIRPTEKSGSGKVLIAKNIEPELYTAWVNDNIQVRSKTLKELAVQLERKYNVNIYIMDKALENKRFTGLLKNETIEQIMQVLKLSAHIDYKIDNRDIWLYKEKPEVNN